MDGMFLYRDMRKGCPKKLKRPIRAKYMLHCMHVAENKDVAALFLLFVLVVKNPD